MCENRLSDVAELKSLWLSSPGYPSTRKRAGRETANFPANRKAHPMHFGGGSGSEPARAGPRWQLVYPAWKSTLTVKVLWYCR